MSVSEQLGETLDVLATPARDVRTRWVPCDGNMRPLTLPPSIPRIVCLCGSTRFKAAFEQATLALGVAGCIVVSVCAYSHADGWKITPEQKADLDELHLRKIDLADCVLVLNVNGYVGASTHAEIAYARKAGKAIVWLEGPENDEAA